MIKAVLFDVDGVLVYSFDANLKFYQDLMTRAGYPPPTREQYMGMYHMTLKSVIETHIPTANPEEVDRIFQMRKNQLVSYPYDLITVPHHLKTVLEELSRSYTLGVVTSRIRGGVFSVPQLTKFEKYFNVATYFDDTENHKPDPEPLTYTVNKLLLHPEEAVYIGDSKTDVEAAHGAGMKVIIFSQNPISEADANTAEFSSLPNIIKSFDS